MVVSWHSFEDRTHLGQDECGAHDMNVMNGNTSGRCRNSRFRCVDARFCAGKLPSGERVRLDATPTNGLADGQGFLPMDSTRVLTFKDNYAYSDFLQIRGPLPFPGTTATARSMPALTVSCIVQVAAIGPCRSGCA